MQMNSATTPRTHQIALAITLLGFVVRLIFLGEHSYWFDEAREVSRALTAWPEVLFVTEGVDPPIYRLLLFPIGLVTQNEFWLRLPSAMFGTAAIYLAFLWLKAIERPRLGLLTAAMIALAPVHIFYSQEVSQYSMTVFLALGVLYAYVNVTKRGERRDWGVLTVVTLLSMFSYYGVAFIFPLLELRLFYHLWRKKERQQWIRWLRFHGLLLLAAISLYSFYLTVHIARFTTRKSLPTIWERGLLNAVQTLPGQVLREFVRFFTTPYAPGIPTWLPYLFLGVTVLGSIFLWLRGYESRWLPVYFVAGVAGMYAGNAVGFYPFGGRYALLLSPFFFAALAEFILWLWRQQRVLGIAALVILFAFFLWWTPGLPAGLNPTTNYPYEDLRTVLEEASALAEQDDPFYIYYGSQPAFDLYADQISQPVVQGVWFRDFPPDEKVADITSNIGEADRFWLIASHLHPGEDVQLMAAIVAQTDFVPQQRLNAPGAFAILYVR